MHSMKRLSKRILISLAVLPAIYYTLKFFVAGYSVFYLQNRITVVIACLFHMNRLLPYPDWCTHMTIMYQVWFLIRLIAYPISLLILIVVLINEYRIKIVKVTK